MQGLKIALTGSSKDSLYDKIHVADYLVFRLNNSKKRNTWYKVLGLQKASDSIHEILTIVAKSQKFYVLKTSKNKEILEIPRVDWDGYDLALFKNSSLDSDGDPDTENTLDLDRAAEYLIDLFRLGKFGRMTLDDCSREGLKSFFESNICKVAFINLKINCFGQSK